MVRVVILRLLESYFRHRWLNLLPILLFAVLDGLYVLFRTPAFQTEARLFVQQESFLGALTEVRDTGYAWVTPAQDTVDQLGELFQTDSFVRAIIRQTALEQELGPEPKDLRDMYKVVRESLGANVQGDSQVGIKALHEDPNVSLQLVEATIESFIQWHINRVRNETESAQVFLDGLVADYKVTFDAANQDLEDYLILHPEPLRGERPAIEQLQIDRLQGEIDLAAQRYIAALDNLETAQINSAKTEDDVRQTYLVIDKPLLADEDNSGLLDAIVSLAIFGVVGIILSVIGIVGGAVLDRSLRFPVDVAQALELPVLAAVPTGNRFDVRPAYADYVSASSAKAAREAARSPNKRQARLIPLVEPPTLVILPADQRGQAAEIARERKRHDVYSNNRQERQRAHGVPARNMGARANPNHIPASASGRHRDS